MSQRRMIDESMWSNEDFAEMPMGARLLQIGMINHADDQGRLKANPAYLGSRIFPYDGIGPDEVQKWLNIMSDNETIILYNVNGKQYAQLVNWWKYQTHQYAQPSEYPRPDGWRDRIRKTYTKGMIVTCNWSKVNGEQIDDTCDQDGKPLPTTNDKNTTVGNNDGLPGEPDLADDYSPERQGEDAGEDTNIRSRSSLIKDQDQHAHVAEPEDKKIDDDSDDLMPGQYLRSLIEGKGFMYLDQNFTELAMKLENQYSQPELVQALEQTHKYHLKKIGKGQRGITAPLAYMSQVLSGSVGDDGEQQQSKAKAMAQRMREGKRMTANDYYRNGRKQDGIGYVPGTALAFLKDYEGPPA